MEGAPSAAAGQFMADAAAPSCCCRTLHGCCGSPGAEQLLCRTLQWVAVLGSRCGQDGAPGTLRSCAGSFMGDGAGPSRCRDHRDSPLGPQRDLPTWSCSSWGCSRSLRCRTSSRSCGVPHGDVLCRSSGVLQWGWAFGGTQPPPMGAALPAPHTAEPPPNPPQPLSELWVQSPPGCEEGLSCPPPAVGSHSRTEDGSGILGPPSKPHGEDFSHNKKRGKKRKKTNEKGKRRRGGGSFRRHPLLPSIHPGVGSRRGGRSCAALHPLRQLRSALRG